MKRSHRQLLPVAAVVLLQLIAVYALVLSLQRELATEFSRNAQVTLDEMTEGVVDRTRRFLRPVHDAVSIGITLMDEGVLDGADDAALEAYFGAQLAATPWLSGLFLGRTDGSFVYLARNEFGQRTKRIHFDDGTRAVELTQRDAGGAMTERWIDAEDEYDPRERSWYRAARTTDTVAWTAPYRFFSSGRPGISAAARSRDGFTLGADVELEGLSAFIETIPHAERGTALIVDDTSSVIARSGSVQSPADLPADDIPTFADVAPAPMLALQAAVANGAAGDTLVELDVDARTFLGLVRSFPIAEGAGSWTLLAQMEADDYAGGALNLFEREVLVLGVISIGLGIIALGGILWLHRIGRRADRDASRDPATGALYRDRFAARLDARFAPGPGRPARRGGVMVVEAHGLMRLADRLGRGSRDAVIVELGRRLRLGLEDDDLLGISPSGRFLVAALAEDRAALIARFERIHACAAADTPFATPAGPQTLEIASGVAVLEAGESVDNLLPRAREALTLGIEEGRTGCHLAIGLDAHGLPPRARAA